MSTIILSTKLRLATLMLAVGFYFVGKCKYLVIFDCVDRGKSF